MADETVDDTGLTKTLKTWWSNREKSATKGLAHMVTTVNEITKKDSNGDPVRNWTPAATLLGLMGADSNEGIMYRRILRAAFGAQITYRKDDNHASGYRFIFTEKIPDGPKGSPVIRNTFGMVMQAAEKGVPFNSKSFQKKLSDHLKEAEGASTPQIWDDKKAEKAVSNLVERAKKDHFPVSRLRAMFEEQIKPLIEAERKANAEAAKNVVANIDSASENKRKAS